MYGQTPMSLMGLVGWQKKNLKSPTAYRVLVEDEEGFLGQTPCPLSCSWNSVENRSNHLVDCRIYDGVKGGDITRPEL